MARKKVKLEWIVNDSARRATFKKRKKGLMKKVSELSTLCDVKACLIVYGPNEPEAEVWPSVPDAMRVLAKLKKMPEMEQSKKMMNQEGFMRQRIMKLQEQLRKQDRENRELETILLMYQGLAGRSLHTVTIEDMTSLAWLIEMKVNKVQERIEHLKGEIASKMVEGMKEEKKKEEGPSNIKEKISLEVAMEELQRQEWFTEIINPHDLMICGNEVVQPYIDHNNPWLDAYFP